ncbi:MAG: DNA-deoxyinosine glycosylase [Treponema sp.]|nr:DNA-deoxyinosine glycosylase [Treponema sp.]
MNEVTVSHIVHPLEPVWNEQSVALVLGTMPSPRSRSAGFYYMHEQNRFWRVLAAIFGETLCYANSDGEAAIAERHALVLRHRVALWDVLASCTISGASDASIKNPVPNDFSKLLTESHITRIYCTGQTAYKLYTKLCESKTHIQAVCLPSTSPANQGRWPIEKLIDAYSCICNSNVQ